MLERHLFIPIVASILTGLMIWSHHIRPHAPGIHSKYIVSGQAPHSSAALTLISPQRGLASSPSLELNSSSLPAQVPSPFHPLEIERIDSK